MEIHRQGANRKEGWTRLKAKKPKAPVIGLSPGIQTPGTSIKGPDPVLTVGHRKVRHSDASGEYDYVIELELTEVAELIDYLATRGLERYGDAISGALSGSVRSLNRLTAAACGLAVANDRDKD
jgi:hypothetical protein